MTDAPAAPRPPAPGKRLSFALAVLIHVALVALLVYGVHWQTQRVEAVEVELVRAVPPAPTAEPAPEPTPAPKAEPPPAPKPEPKPEPKQEAPKPAPKPEIAQKEKPKPEPKPEPKAEPKPAPDPFKEQLERELKEAEKRKQEAAAAKELAELKARQAASAQASAMAAYIAAIRGKVRGNIVLPAEVKGNPEAVFEVTQLPSGEILSARLKKSSGNPSWDAATERAILKSSPLPKPAQAELFSRTLELKFRPQEE